jgi:hypothetical protein
MVLANGNTYATSFNPTSDRNAKENFDSISPAEVLAKVVGLPIQQWNFKNDGSTRHIGPVAQDFYEAFKVGSDDKHIATVDADGVALAAIQGLNQKVEGGTKRADARIEQLEAQNTELKKRLSEIEVLLGKLTKKD